MNHAQLALSAANPGLLPMALSGGTCGCCGEYTPSEEETRYDNTSIAVALLTLAAMCGLAFRPYTGLI